MKSIAYGNLTNDELKTLISSKTNFEVKAVGGVMSDAVALIEKQIESLDMRCRIYTRGRVAAAGATLFGGVTGVLGAASVVGMAAHNLATFNPDYEIIKHQIDNKITVMYKK